MSFLAYLSLFVLTGTDMVDVWSYLDTSSCVTQVFELPNVHKHQK